MGIDHKFRLVKNVLQRTLPENLYRTMQSLAAIAVSVLVVGFMSGIFYFIVENTLIHTRKLVFFAALSGLLMANIFFWMSKGKYHRYDWGILLAIFFLGCLFSGFAFLTTNRLLAEKDTQQLEYVIFATYEKKMGSDGDDLYAVAVIYIDKAPMHVRLPAQFQGRIPDKAILRIQKSEGFFGFDVIREMEIREYF